MTEFLLRRFAPGGGHSAIGKMAGAVGIACNVALFLVKLAAGLLTRSVAIVSDAVNNLTDASSSVVTLLGFHMAQRPADEDHPFGHARYEYLSGLAVVVLILVVGAELVKTSVGKILRPEEVEFSAAACAVMAAAVGVKAWMAAFYRILGNRIGSTALRAASADSRNDAAATAGVLAGYAAGRAFGVNIDGWIGLCVAGMILYSAVGLAKETISPLLGARADGELEGKLRALAMRDERVLGVHDLLVHDYGPGQCFASVHAELSAQVDPLTGHEIIDEIERAALREMNVHLVVHLDPVE